MKTLVAFPSTAIFGQQAALAFEEARDLEAFFTTYAFKNSGMWEKMLSVTPVSQKLIRELKRRSITEIPAERIETRPLWEVIRTLAAKSGAGAQTIDKIWDALSLDFTRAVARRLQLGSVDAVYAYEYSALEAFQEAERLGIAKILDFPSLNSRQFDELERGQKALFPELKSVNDSYFDSVFAERQARRDAEMSAADVIITNSSVSRLSHIAAGADPTKVFSVNYGAPPTIDSVGSIGERTSPLRMIWAGTFSIRKGAHLFVDAWRGLDPRYATTDIYGAIVLPDRAWKPAPTGLRFHGSVVRAALFDAFTKSDVLMFPTLSDGFGMVVTEAFAHGLPVITTSQAGASDLVQHGRNGLIIEPGSAKAIRESIMWCLDNRPKLLGMREAALETAKKWQWSDYRVALRSAVSDGLQRARRYTQGL